jgi:isoleucyl-tRNA synthetase
MDKNSATKSQFAQREEQILDFWKKNKIFEKSISNRKNSPIFSFYDGPPFANGQPHFGHSLVASIKDAIGRYKTMRGYKVDRRNGWDCHGLPVEFAIEKQFGVSGKKQILDLGLDKFNAACRASVFQYKGEWEDFFERIGRWTDTEHSYATIDRNYTESVWWVLKQISDKGLLYKSYKSMPYCPRCETPLSNFEVNEGYQDDTPDPSLFVKFKLKDEDAYMLAWTTTPWSLPGNAAIAVKPDEQYVYASLTDEQGRAETLILAKKRLDNLKSDKYKVIKEIKGIELAGKSYEPLFITDTKDGKSQFENFYKVIASEAVDIEDGTGVLHVAPAFGEDDLDMADKFKLPVLLTVNPSGKIQNVNDLPEIDSMFFKEADQHIIDYLTHKNFVFAVKTAYHTYPFCYRCESPLLYYAISTWFVKVPDIKENLLKNADKIKWMPDYIKEGRFGKWLEGARDWAISRNRYWGAPMPIWVNTDDESDYIVVGSIEDLKNLAGQDIKVDDLHRPFIDEISFKKDGKQYKRVEEVLDCWFESGSMPVAQQHYPFENESQFKESFPADYVGEALDQTHLWFYVLHVISTILFDSPAYKNVLVNGLVMAADGQKLSKRLKNYPAVDDVFDKEGADTLRLYLLSNYQAMGADYVRFNRDVMKNINQNIVGTISNSFRFFKMYADIDNWKPNKKLLKPDSKNILDIWITARVNQTVDTVTKEADAYRLAYAINPIYELIDDLSNWFIRRSRRRFWKSEDDEDKIEAYETLYCNLVKISQLLAPWAPFIAEDLWQGLGVPSVGSESVHLSGWPKADAYDKDVIEKMTLVRSYIAEGLKQRALEGIKVRQPLKSVAINTEKPLDNDFQEIIKEELNVKEIEFTNTGNKVVIDTTMTENLKLEGIARDIIRQIQETRKKAGLDVDDRIVIKLESDDAEIQGSIEAHQKDIYSETLAVEGEIDKL